MKPAHLSLVVTSLLLAACSAFSTQPAPEVVSRVHETVAPGMALADARSAVIDLGFSCIQKRGDYRDEAGKTTRTPISSNARDGRAWSASTAPTAIR